MIIRALLASALLSASVGASWSQSLLNFVRGVFSPAAVAAPASLEPLPHPLAIIGGESYQQATLLASFAFDSATELASLKAATILDGAVRVAETAHIRPYWFVDVSGPEDILSLQRRYGVTEEHFRALNPGVDFASLQEKTQVLLYRYDPSEPPSSYGKANSGRLVNGMPMIEGESWYVRDPRESWGTPEVVRYLARGFEHVDALYPGRSRIMVGDLSLARGGRLAPHKSHRTGRDVDASYYGLEGAPKDAFWNALSPNFDVERNWSLFKYWIDQGIVEYIFVDTRLQRALANHALQSGEDPEYVRSVFQAIGKHSAPIRHARGHADHFHVRFRCESWDTNCR